MFTQLELRNDQYNVIFFSPKALFLNNYFCDLSVYF